MTTPTPWDRWRSDPLTLAKLTASALFALAFVLYAAAYTADGWIDEPVVMVATILTTLGPLAAIVTVWRPMLGAALCLPTIVSSLAFHGGMDLPLAALIVGIFAATQTRASVGTVLALAFVHVVARASMSLPDERASFVLTAAVSILVPLGIGLVARHFLRSGEKAKRRIAELEQTHARVRAEERTALARELHDVVAHQLSVVSLQIMGHGDSDDVGELQQTMGHIDTATRSALGELRLLVGMLRETDAAGADAAGMAEEAMQPSALAHSLEETLRANGYAPTFSVPARADELDAARRRTLCRILQEASTNILRHTPSGSACSFEVGVEPDAVTVRVASPLGQGRLRSHSLGVGLRGLAERVDLLGGEFDAGPDAGMWVVRGKLPVG